MLAKLSLPSRYLCSVGFSLFLATPLLELHATHVHHSGGDFVNVVLFFLGETEHIEGFLFVCVEEIRRVPMLFVVVGAK